MGKSNRMEMPYKHFAGKKNDTSKPYYMLSELIDNSISSWKDNNKEGVLSIAINIDDTTQQITVDDTAFGMSEDGLSESMKLNKEKAGNKLNMFGVGMKNSAFWFGKDLHVETNNGQGAWQTDISLSKVMDLNKTIEWVVRESNREKRGTKVTISHVYKDRTLSKDDFEVLLNVLQIKYQNYIEEGVKINISWFKNDGSAKHKKLNKLKIKAQIIPDNKIQEFINGIDKYFEKSILKYAKDLKERTIKLVKNKKRLIYNYEIPFVMDGQRKTFKIKVGIQDESNKGNPEGFKAYYGLTTLQDNRAINMPPLSAIDFTNDYTRRNAKRIFGIAELGHIFKPDNNKQEFNFGTHKDRFYGLIKDIGSEIELVADIVQDLVGTATKSKSGNQKQSISKIENALITKSGLDWSVNTNGTNFNLSIGKGEEVKIIIKEKSIENKNDQNYFINAEEIGEKEYQITYNVNHPIWKPLSDGSGTNIDTKIVTYPLVAIIGISSLGIKDRIISEILGNDFDENDVLSIINYISQVVIK